MDVFKLAIHGTGYPLPGGYDELPAYLCITMSAASGNEEKILKIRQIKPEFLSRMFAVEYV